MDFYTFSATAIPVIWAACRLAQPQHGVSKRHALGWLLLKVLLIAGEVSSVLSLGRGHDDAIGSWVSAAALIVGGLVLVAPPIAKDLTWLGVRAPARKWGAVFATVLIGWLALRFG